MIFLYFLIVWVVWIYTDFGCFGTIYTPITGLGTYLMLTFYTVFCAFVHLPVNNKDKDRYMFEQISNGFSLTIARWMLDISWQAYGVHPKLLFIMSLLFIYVCEVIFWIWTPIG